MQELKGENLQSVNGGCDVAVDRTPKSWWEQVAKLLR